MVGSKNKKLQLILLYTIAIIFLIIMVYPYLYMVLNSLAPWDQVDRKIIPTGITLKSYIWLLRGGEDVTPRPWLRAFANSIIVTVSSTFLMMVTALLVAYALSKIVFKGSRTINNIIMFQMFYPSIILLIPTFLLVRKLGLYDTYWGMIIPKSVSLWAIFMYTNFFKAIPNELIEAAKIDGANEIKILFKIVLPMSKSITTVIFLFLFMERWVELLWDMLVVHDQNLLTLNVMLAQMFGPYGAYPGPMYAASVILTMPILILFIIFSKNFKEGIQFVLK
ncbi:MULTISPECIES: carbohydrate ABC transporter permease [Thermoanaerobacter]|uniref:ABC-type sugar transport system, permease component n=3 Tax=Thermoanaerobacter TaxID=1754 RepID=I8R4D2_9THEO|nr:MULTISPECIES: carbohydrate ABC transporter permease [Thermoanaerobacter]EGD52011.1 binding-protein-dependent transport systems inner membrane component [Thermoanaerobacter ethanolicus JW 200]AEM77583.1 ABC-type transporter, integral membrane subunit [Thermoanaerobacter wiegelii Rt8.B1]AIS51276.1 carbohydrate ABC transporter membrane protein 2, CUT1 family [Thermoanaerobacter kivui]EIW00280.1 ABC-type sugar transport system, permease component [Thermoanaerobacter siderophilus SR4]UZQ83078.1 